MWMIGLVIGLLVGNAIDNAGGAALGAVAGFVLGLWEGRYRKLRTAKLADLELHVTELAAEIAALKQGVIATDPPVRASPVASVADVVAQSSEQPLAPALEIGTVAARVAAAEATSSLVPPAIPEVDTVGIFVRKGGAGVSQPAPSSGPVEIVPATPFTPTPRPAWLQWLIGGNTLARIGVLILFIGVGFLLKFAAERVVVPIEMRLAGVALGAIVLLALGWRLRSARPGYAMILQGGGVGVMYLTIFAALKLYSLLPPTAAFALLFMVAAFSSWLAIKQDTLALAALGVIGGFLAPILTSTGSGSHVLLFSYYTLLNASILAIAWFKSWRALNVLGFVFTFGVAVVWGVDQYRPEFFATTEPFLVLSLLFYVAIAVLYALRRSVTLRDYVDSTLVFGTPLVVAGLQSGLVRDTPFGMALSALAAAVMYLSLAKVLYSRRQESLRMLVEAFLALGVIFATLAIPLALDARWTSGTWALEGAALLWVGVRQQRLSARVFGALLQLAAGTALAFGSQVWHGQAPSHPWPILNSDCIGALLLALAGLFSAWQLQRRKDLVRSWEQVVALLLFTWGTLWWLFAGWHEIDRWLPAGSHMPAVVGLLTLTALLFAVIEQAARWPLARIPVLATLPLLLLLVVGATGHSISVATSTHLFARGGYLTWPLAVIAMMAILKHYDRPDVAAADNIAAPLDWWHAGLLWLIALLAAHELAWAGSHLGTGNGVWTVVPWGLVGAAALFVVTAFADTAVWPMNRHRVGYLVYAAVPIAVAVALWSISANFEGDADPLPLPYFPLFNPLDITQVLALLALATWVLRLQRDRATLGGLLRPAILGGALAALLFVWINAVVLRTIHFWWDVPYTVDALWASRLVQVSLSLLWSCLALATMVFANRRLWRIAWVAGATLLAVVVLKLFLVDLSQVGGVERIVSFIGVGVLLLAIGFLAPVPPRRMETA